MGARCRIGPYARLRPGVTLAEDVHIGNFVEVKASRIGAGSKANHLAYIGDAEVGARVNVGAGTITCNYDGAAKHRTVIEDDCFIGSDATLVAPVRIAKGSYIGAGSTISKDTPPGQLTVARARQVSIPRWTRRARSRPGRSSHVRNRRLGGAARHPAGAGRGPAAARVPGLRLLRRGGARGQSIGAAAQRRPCFRSFRSNRKETPLRGDRDRAYPLGDPWRAGHAQRASRSSRAARSRWCTTASSRITTSCARS